MGGKIRCLKCLEIIHSMSVHDFVSCKCGLVSVDGGFDYVKISGAPSDWEMVDHTHENKNK